MTIKLIIGLRNPGSAYESTRHNAGGWFVSALAHHVHSNFNHEKKMHAEVANLTINSQTCKAAMPTTYMNLSGLAVREISQFYRIQPEEILVAHDELDLEAGRIKLKTGGGHGGHNGLRDIIAHLGKADFHRLRIGIGHPGNKDQVLNYVLGRPSKEDFDSISDAIHRAIDVIPTVLNTGMSAGMNLLNG